MKAELLVMISIMLISGIYAVNASSQQLIISSRILDSDISTTEIPTIIGNIKDTSGNPIQGASVQTTFGAETVAYVTNNVGSFELKPSKPLNPGSYVAQVTATKPSYDSASFSINFSVTGNPLALIQPAVDMISNTGIPQVISDGITQNPISQMLQKQFEEITKAQLEAEKKRNDIEAKNKLIEEQRRTANLNLQKDLEAFAKSFDPFSPRNAFASFVEGVDETVKSVFWGQFELTEKKSQEAHQAKLKALQEGKSSYEATKIFHRKAAISQNELIEHNQRLNVLHGLADEEIQKTFNEYGKLPRED